MKEKFLERSYKGLKVFETGEKTAQENMEMDRVFLETLDPSGPPILHLYRWEKPSLTYGYFVKLEEFVDLKEMQARGLEAARRPTGGGIVFHIWDLAFSFLLPAGHPSFSLSPLSNYHLVNSAVLQAVQEVFSLPSSLLEEDAKAEDAACSRFCMARPTKYDVIWEGRKVAGAAQRKTKAGFLHQGTISLGSPDFSLLEAVLLSSSVQEAMRAVTFTPLGKRAVGEEIRREIEEKLVEKLSAVV